MQISKDKGHPLQIVLLFVAFFCFTLHAVAQESHPILIISSYNPDTRNTVQNVTSFTDEYRLLGGKQPIVVENMNCRSMQETNQWRSRLHGILSNYQGDKTPSLIVLLGQEAWASFISLDTAFTRTPILCGLVSRNAVLLPDSSTDINHWEPEYTDIATYQQKGLHVGGFLYSYDVRRNINLILHFYPNTKNIALITDNTYGGVSLQTLVKREMKPIKNLNLILLDGSKMNAEEIGDRINRLPDNTIVLIGTWRVDKDDHYYIGTNAFPFAKLRPDIPAFSISSLGIGSCAIGGYTPKYRNVGGELAHKAYDLIAGKASIDSLRAEVVDDQYLFDMKMLNQYGFTDSQIPRNSIFVNEKPDFFDVHRTEIYAGVIIVLLFFMISISISFIRTNRFKNKMVELERDKSVILNNINSSVTFVNPDLTVRWKNNISYPCVPQYGERNCFLLDNPTPPYCEKCPVIRAMQTHKTVDREGRSYICSNVHTVAIPIFNKERLFQGVVVKKDDISAARRYEDQLQLAKEKAEESDRLKSAFLANMSHEIRTPLNAIIGFSSLLTQAETQEEREEYDKIINTNNELLLQLINDILDLSKIEAGTLEFNDTDVDINNTLSDIEQSLKLKTSEEVTLSFVEKMTECHILTDKNRLAQVVVNLINNAIKFTEKGHINFGYYRREHDLYFYVSDTGCGIPEDKRAAIFSRFVKLNSFIQGTGLGLSICQMIVKKIGGEIGVESEVGIGSTFWFTIPNSLIIHPND